ncbi:MAG: rhodanese-like domain-containing protein [Deinococcota bacterium]|jgi:rhodanese-related sulfurtransferase|nr:rhodanese-like domain-containing protein [Deinococcota bacterium]MDQ3459049.1 rhodanese-like domain-containing protein [Deinococcota bacterium]
MAQELRKAAKDMVAEAKGRIENLMPDQVEKELQRPDVVLVDLREAAEREQDGMIPGAVHITRGMLEFRADPSTPYHNAALQPERRVILHCASGGRSALAAATLQEMGYTDVAHMDGGFKAWQAEGKPVEKL